MHTSKEASHSRAFVQPRALGAPTSCGCELLKVILTFQGDEDKDLSLPRGFRLLILQGVSLEGRLANMQTYMEKLSG